MANNTAIYTVVTNGYDTVKPFVNEQGYDYYLFTDQQHLEVKGWTTIYTKDPQRKLKILPFDVLKEYDDSLYLDANMSPISVSRFISLVRSSDMLTFKHPVRNCFIDEHYACIEANKAEHSLIRDQLAYNIKVGLKPKSGMYQTGVIYRKHTEEVIQFCSAWYAELSKYTHRDQLSIMTAVHLTGFVPSYLNWNIFNKHFRIYPHNVKPEVNVYYFTPYDTKGNIGKAMNNHCKLVPNDNDWIAVMDGDILFPNPKWGKIVENAIKEYGDKYQLMGCMTNRVGSEHQCIDGMFGEMDLLKHYEIATSLIDAVEPLGNLGIAGYFMLFQKKTWLKCGGFTENTNLAHQFDTEFNKSVRKIGGKLGLIKGLYALHMYRIKSGTDRMMARKDVEHLFVNK
jgi:hypothetical protein